MTDTVVGGPGAVDGNPRRARSEAAAPRGRAARSWRAVGLLIAAQSALFLVLTRRAWFFSDDFLFLAQARERKLSGDFLTEGLFEHFSPVHRLFDYAQARAFGLNWTAARLVLVLLMGAAVAAFYALAESLVRRPPLALLLAAAYGTSIFFVRNSTWWTGGVHLTSLVIAQLLTLLGFVRWHQTGSRRWLTLSAGAHVVALLTHEQAFLMPAYLVLLQLFVLSPGPLRLAPLVRQWRVWLLFGVPTLLAIVNFVANYRIETEATPPTTLVRFTAVSLFEGFLPTLFGIKYPEAMVSSYRATVIIAAGLFAALVVASLRRNTEAWRAWAFFASTFLVAVVPLGIGRVETLGITVGREPRYQMTPAFLVLLALGAAFSLPARPAAPGRLQGRRWAAVAPLLALLYAGAHIRGAERLESAQWEPAGPRRYFGTLGREVDRLRAAGHPFHVFPDVVPQEVVPGWLFPYNRYEHAVALAEPGALVGRSRSGHTISPDGRLNAARFAPLGRARFDLPEAKVNGLERSAAAGGAEACFRSTAAGSVWVPAPAAAPAQPTLVAVRLRSSAASVELLVASAGEVLEVYPPADLAGDDGDRVLRSSRPVKEVGLSITGPGLTCVESVELGTLRAVP